MALSTTKRLKLSWLICTLMTQSYTDKNMAAAKKINLEKSLAELEELVEELESGDLPLETAMKKFEDGIKLTRGCQAALKDAEQKVQILLKSAGGDELSDFEIDDPP
jgi:exodeoxyribonuclease VII small subunit